MELSVPLAAVSLHTTSDQATGPPITLQEREMEVAVMELTTTLTCPGAGTKCIECNNTHSLIGWGLLSLTVTSTAALDRSIDVARIKTVYASATLRLVRV